MIELKRMLSEFKSPIRGIVHADNLDFLHLLPDEAIDLIYIDPPFNTGKTRRYKKTRVRKDPFGKRVGFQNTSYTIISEQYTKAQYRDYFDDFLGFLAPRLKEAYRVLKSTGSLFVHLDFREVHYVKVMLDEIFGRDSFINEIIWAYDYGGRSKRYWPRKHDNILWYAKNPDRYTFNYDSIDRIPYMSPSLVGKEKAAIGKVPTDVWWNTIVPTNSRERTGYPTQKPLAIIERIIRVHSNPGDLVLDFFAGSGTLGHAAVKHNRQFLLVDNNIEAIRTMIKRLHSYNPQCFCIHPETKKLVLCDHRKLDQGCQDK